MAYQYKPSPWQQKMHESNARLKVIWAGRRAGKGRADLSELMTAIETAAQTPFLATKEISEGA